MIKIKVHRHSLCRLHLRHGRDAVQALQTRDGKMTSTNDGEANPSGRRRRMEIFAFLFLTAVLMPALAVATVGTYGLAVWIYQAVTGPPGPPPR